MTKKDIKTMTADELFPNDNPSDWNWLKHVKGYHTDNGYRITVFAKGGPPTEYEYMMSEVRFNTQETKWVSNKSCPTIESAAIKCLKMPKVVSLIKKNFEQGIYL